MKGLSKAPWATQAYKELVDCYPYNEIVISPHTPPMGKFIYTENYVCHIGKFICSDKIEVYKVSLRYGELRWFKC